MKTAWVTGKRKIELIDEEYKKPVGNEVVVKIKACGICGTDLHFYNDYPGNKPIPLGHEAAGSVYEIGNDITDIKPGDSVVIQNHVPCGKCYSCLQGDLSHCRDIQTYMNDCSGMADFIKVKRSMIIHFRDLDYIEAVLAEPLTVALDITREARIKPFQNVCISGPGIIGLFCTKLSQLGGAQNIIILGRRFHTERGKRRIEAAKLLGATMAFDTDKTEWKDEMQNKFPDGIERIIVTSPPQTIPDMFDIASFGAIVAFNGISFREANITFNANEFHFKKLKLIASHAIPNWGFPLALKLLSQKFIKHETLVTHVFPFEKIGDAFSVANSKNEGIIKLVITF